MTLTLKHWDKIVEERERVYVTDARSVFDYLSKESTSTSSDKRMAIEGALLRETVRRPRAHTRWIDGEQNLANILTKFGADKSILFQYLRDGLLSLVQTEANKRSKEKKRQQRQHRKQVLREDPRKQKIKDDRIKALAKQMQQEALQSSDDAKSTKEK